jgi:hypothetical protein
MSEAFAPPATEAPAALPAAFELAALSVRPTRTAGGQPAAAVVLVELEQKGLE